MSQIKVLIVQLASNGDCLFVTTLARQIKEIDYPDSHLTWMIASVYLPVLKNNPHVDEVIEIPLGEGNDIVKQRNLIESHLENHKDRGFDKIFITDYRDKNLSNWFGTTRSSLFRSYPNRIKVPIEPLIYLDDNEVERVNKFANRHDLVNNRFNIIFESGPQSAQSHMSMELTLAVSRRIVRMYPFVKIIVSSKNQFQAADGNIIDGSVISWRENAELTKYCHLLVGCSSGITWLNTSNWSNKINSVQFINPNYFKKRVTASVKADFLYFGLNTDSLIEITEFDEQLMVECISTIVDSEFAVARRKYDSSLFPNYGGYKFLNEVLLRAVTRDSKLSSIKLFFALLPANIYCVFRSLIVIGKTFLAPVRIKLFF